MSGAGRTSPARRRRATSTTRARRSPIRRLAIAGLMSISALTWSRGQGSSSNEITPQTAGAQKVQVNDQSEVRVELDIFSGRPNPSWMLAPPERDELLRALSAAKREAAARELPGLGYRGFAVHVG